MTIEEKEMKAEKAPKKRKNVKSKPKTKLGSVSKAKKPFWKTPVGGTLTAAAVLGSMYGIYKGVRWFLHRKANPEKSTFKAKYNASNIKRTNPTFAIPVQLNDQFPLKMGSTGQRVVKLQQAFDKLGYSIGITGIMNLDTIQKLNSMGYPASLLETHYNEILTKAGISILDIVFDPKAVAQELHQALSAQNIILTINALRKIKDIQSYESTKNEFIKKPVYSIASARNISTTSLVNGVLEVAFKNDEPAKEQLRKEFIRMGLKWNANSGQWNIFNG